MNSPRTRRLARRYLAAVDKVLLALDRAKELRAALRRSLVARECRVKRRVGRINQAKQGDADAE
jgi:hypothetical protein